MELLTVIRPFVTGRALAALFAVSLLTPIVWLFGPMLHLGASARSNPRSTA